MFEIMKILRKDGHYNTNERVNLDNLRIGCTVGFGFLPQRNISGCRMKVKTANSYIFGDDIFLSYVLDNEDNDINMIITRNEGETVVSLSQRVEKHIYPMLFLSHQPENWFSMKIGDALETSRKVMGMQQSWIAPHYKLAMLGGGTLIEGDHRLLKKPHSTEHMRHFDYALFLDDGNEQALEAEKYADGTLIVYSTVYRPAMDIGEIAGPPSSHIQLSPHKDEEPKLELSENAIGSSDTLLHPKLNGSSSLHEETVASHADDMLAIDTKLAGKIIHEAQSNNMSIADLIRKVIDLPASITDQIMLALSLTDEERKELARRYNLSSSDHEGVKRQIIKELQQFVGNKN